MSEGNGNDSEKFYIAMKHSTAEKLLKPGNETALRLWVALALGADWTTGEVIRSYKYLLEHHGISGDTVAKGLRDLRGLNLLESKRRFSQATKHFIKGYAVIRPSSPQNRVQAQHSSAKPSKALGNTESSSPQNRVHYSVSPDTNDHLENDRLKNEGGAAPLPALQMTGDLIALAKSRGFNGFTTWGLDVFNSVVKSHGPEKVKRFLETAAPGDVKDIKDQITKAAFVPLGKKCLTCSDDPRGVFDGMKDGERTFIPCRFCASRAARVGGAS